MKKLSLTFLLVVVFSLTCKQEAEVKSLSEDRNQKNSSPHFALLVGINSYANLPSMYQLEGCVNDVNLMKKLLIEVFQFDSTHIRTLTDESATRENIINEFEKFLIHNARKEGQALFYYSGHGAQMTDLNRDEADGYDETIVPHDSRDKKKRVIDIPDDKLGELLGKLTQKCKNVTVMFDCCHSGSGVRGEIAKPRQLPKLELEGPKTRAEAITTDGPSGFLPPASNYVHISACKDREYALEYAGHGVLTYFFNRVVRNNPNATYREIMHKVREDVAFDHPTQTPQLEGVRRDAPIFRDLGHVEEFIEVVDVKEDKVQLSAGMAHNVTEGSIYALYESGTTTPENNEDNYLGEVKITQVNPFTSWAQFEEKKGSHFKNAAAFETAHHYGDMQMAVRLNLKDEPDLQAKVEQAFAEHKDKEDLIKVVSDKAKYDINIRFENDKLILERPDLTQLKKLEPDDNSIKYSLIDILTTEARRMNVFKLENQKSKLTVDMKLERWEDVDENITPVNKLEIEETEGGQRVLNEGDIIRLTIKNTSRKSLYPYLLDIGTGGNISLLFPAEGAEDSPLNPGESIQTSLMQITPPEGLNALKLIATTIPTDFSVLTQQGYRSIDPTQTAQRGLDSPLGKLLSAAWGGKRDVKKLKPKKIEDWTTDMISFYIRAEEK